MNIPVSTWRQDVGSSPIYWDLVDPKLCLYGPRPLWRDFHRQAVGPATIIYGVISFGYLPEEVAALAHQLPGKHVAALVPSGVATAAQIALEIAAPHKATLTLTHSIPFPDLRLSATLQGDDALAAEIERRWNDRTLLNGPVNFTFDMRNAVGGYQTIIDYKACAEWFLQQPRADSGFVAAEAAALVAEFVAANVALLEFMGPREDAAQRQVVASKLAEILLQGVLVENGSIIEFDNGEKLTRWSVRAPGSLVAPARRIFVHSEATLESLQFMFP